LRDTARQKEPVAPTPTKRGEEDLREARGLEGVARQVALGAHRAVIARVLAGVGQEDAKDSPVADAGNDEVPDVDRVEHLAAAGSFRVLLEKRRSEGRFLSRVLGERRFQVA